MHKYNQLNNYSKNSFRKKLKKFGGLAYQTIKQSPDADLLLIGAIGNLFINDFEFMSLPLTVLAAKQYISGWWAYNEIQKAIQSRDGQINVKTLKRRFSMIKEGPCNYFGAKYAIREYQKSLEKSVKS